LEPENILRDQRAILRLSPTPDAVNDGLRIVLSYTAQGLEDVVKFRIDTGAQEIKQ
jgi:hypothetical protein